MGGVGGWVWGGAGGGAGRGGWVAGRRVFSLPALPAPHAAGAWYGGDRGGGGEGGGGGDGGGGAGRAEWEVCTMVRDEAAFLLE